MQVLASIGNAASAALKPKTSAFPVVTVLSFLSLQTGRIPFLFCLGRMITHGTTPVNRFVHFSAPGSKLRLVSDAKCHQSYRMSTAVPIVGRRTRFEKRQSKFGTLPTVLSTAAEANPTYTVSPYAPASSTRR